MTHLEKLKAVYDELSIQYHELKSDSGYTYIQKLRSGEEKNKTMYVTGYGMVSLTKPEQLDHYFEFAPDGEIASW
jgi:ActR/RegA family two-component response regulator